MMSSYPIHTKVETRGAAVIVVVVVVGPAELAPMLDPPHGQYARVIRSPVRIVI